MTIDLISRHFEQDHDRLDDLLQEYQRLKHEDFKNAADCFFLFEKELFRHIAWEEDILFPLFEKITKTFEHGPTSVMKLEHKEIMSVLESMRAKISSGQNNTGREEEQLLIALGNHNLKEESVLYPMLDDHASEAERKNVFYEMEHMPESRYRPSYAHV